MGRTALMQEEEIGINYLSRHCSLGSSIITSFMKRKLGLLIVVSVTLTLMLGMGVKFWPSVFGFILFRSNNYAVFNEKHQPIKAWVFEKRQTSQNEATFELIVYFPSQEKYRFLTIVPAHRLIGLADTLVKNIWVFPGPKIAYMLPAGSFFTPLNGPYFELISEYEFSENLIWFNTFGELRKIGNRIVIQRNR